MKATVPVFIVGVTFPRKKPGGVDRAFVELHDDSDSHAFRVAVATKDARKLQEALERNEEYEETDDAAQGQLTVTYPSEDPEHQVVARAADGPVLRPHTIAGWWQVWSGTICLALLRPEDVLPLSRSVMLDDCVGHDVTVEPTSDPAETGICDCCGSTSLVSEGKSYETLGFLCGPCDRRPAK